MSRVRVTDWMSRSCALSGPGAPATLLLAGNRFEAKAWAGQTQIRRWVFVRNEKILRDFGPLSRVILIGTWADRPDAWDLYKYVHFHKYIIEEVSWRIDA